MTMQMQAGGNQNQTLAAFLITRPPVSLSFCWIPFPPIFFFFFSAQHAWLGWGWESDQRQWLPIFQLDVGVPLGLCKEGPTGVFSRPWSRGTAQLDCNTWTASLPFSM